VPMYVLVFVLNRPGF